MSPVAAGGVSKDEALSWLEDEVAYLINVCESDEWRHGLELNPEVQSRREYMEAILDQLTAAQAEADRLRVDAERWRTLREHFKSDHIFYHVLGAPAGYESVEDAIDAVTAAGTWEVLHPDTALHAATEQERGE